MWGGKSRAVDIVCSRLHIARCRFRCIGQIDLINDAVPRRFLQCPVCACGVPRVEACKNFVLLATDLLSQDVTGDGADPFQFELDVAAAWISAVEPNLVGIAMISQHHRKVGAAI